MIFWIKRFALVIGIAVFFAVFFLSIAGRDPFEPTNFIPALVKAFCGATLFWFGGFIVGDILLKGVLSDIDYDDANLIEGGLLQQITQKQKLQITDISNDVNNNNNDNQGGKKEEKEKRKK